MSMKCKEISKKAFEEEQGGIAWSPAARAACAGGIARPFVGASFPVTID